MKSKVYTVYDSKTEAYLKPFFMRTKGEAIRAFQDTVNDESSQFWKHPEDYTLFEIGEYDELSARMMPNEALIPLGTALEHKKINENARA